MPLSSSRNHYVTGRRAFFLVIAASLVAAMLVPGGAADATEVPDAPTVEGPITGPGPMHVGLRPGPAGTNPEDFDYVTEEYFVSGLTGPTGSPYAVRVMVRRPERPERFSGVVVAEATHFSGNALVCNYARFGIFQRGHVCVDVMARPVNITNTLLPFNSARYDDLTVTDEQTNEVLAQVANLLREGGTRNPLGELGTASTVVLAGTSDSSRPARAFMADGHDTFRRADGSALFDGYFVHATLGPDPVIVPDAPTVQMPTQTEVHATDAYRQPDSDDPDRPFRLYEVAGMSHSDSRENPQNAGLGCDNENFSQFPFGALVFLGLQHTIDWTQGSVPPEADRIEVDNSGATRVALDQFGNAKGGVRSTYLDVPTHTYSIPNSPGFLCSLTSYQTPLPDHVLDELYPNRGRHASAVNSRLAELIRQGWFPREYAHDYVREDMRSFLHGRRWNGGGR